MAWGLQSDGGRLVLNVGLAGVLYALLQLVWHGATLAGAAVSGLAFGLIYGVLLILVQMARGRS